MEGFIFKNESAYHATRFFEAFKNYTGTAIPLAKLYDRQESMLLEEVKMVHSSKTDQFYVRVLASNPENTNAKTLLVYTPIKKEDGSYFLKPIHQARFNIEDSIQEVYIVDLETAKQFQKQDLCTKSIKFIEKFTKENKQGYEATLGCFNQNRNGEINENFRYYTHLGYTPKREYKESDAIIPMHKKHEDLGKSPKFFKDYFSRRNK